MAKQHIPITVVPNYVNPLFAQRETEIFHTPYAEECLFYNCIEKGDTKNIEKFISKFLNLGIKVGKLSANSLRQVQYWAVCCVTLGARSAIKGGLDENLAFNLSDKYIETIDTLTNISEIIDFLEKVVKDVTLMVKESLESSYPLAITNAVKYIRNNLHKPIKIASVAQNLSYSEDYLAHLFKKHMNITIGDFILKCKLESAKNMLDNNVKAQDISYFLGFCSQSYFITRFKKEYGLTPLQYKQKSRF